MQNKSVWAAKRQYYGRRVFGLAAYGNVWVWLMAAVLAALVGYNLVLYSASAVAAVLVGAALAMFGLNCGVALRSWGRTALVMNVIFIGAFLVFIWFDIALTVYSIAARGSAGGTMQAMADAFAAAGPAMDSMAPEAAFALTEGMVGMGGGALDLAGAVLTVLPAALLGLVCFGAGLVALIGMLKARGFFLLSAAELKARAMNAE